MPRVERFPREKKGPQEPKVPLTPLRQCRVWGELVSGNPGAAEWSCVLPRPVRQDFVSRDGSRLVGISRRDQYIWPEVFLCPTCPFSRGDGATGSGAALGFACGLGAGVVTELA